MTLHTTEERQLRQGLESAEAHSTWLQQQLQSSQAAREAAEQRCRELSRDAGALGGREAVCIQGRVQGTDVRH